MIELESEIVIKRGKKKKKKRKKKEKLKKKSWMNGTYFSLQREREVTIIQNNNL